MEPVEYVRLQYLVDLQVRLLSRPTNAKAQGILFDEKSVSDLSPLYILVNFLQPIGYMMHQQFDIQQLYALPTLYLCVLYLSENKQRLVPLTA